MQAQQKHNMDYRSTSNYLVLVYLEIYKKGFTYNKIHIGSL